jgi:hypothetical protein
MQKSLCFFAFVITSLLAFGQSARADPQVDTSDSLDKTLCGIIEASAVANNLPIGFLTRLIWQENALRLDGLSPAGAEGVAQFMPLTAAERGLVNPFDPEKAIPEAAKFLTELSNRFGNIGLAAAGYNAGPARTARWLAGRDDMPQETRAYVYAITARTVDDWAKTSPPPSVPTTAPPSTSGSPPPTPPSAPPSAAASADVQSCLPIIEAKRRGIPADTLGLTPFAPWGVQLAGNFSKAVALAAFERVRQRYQAILGGAEPFILASRLRSRGLSPFFRVRLPAPTQAEAQRLCDRLHSVGASCIVLRS